MMTQGLSFIFWQVKRKKCDQVDYCESKMNNIPKITNGIHKLLVNY